MVGEWVPQFGAAWEGSRAWTLSLRLGRNCVSGIIVKVGNGFIYSKLAKSLLHNVLKPPDPFSTTNQDIVQQCVRPNPLPTATLITPKAYTYLMPSNA